MAATIKTTRSEIETAEERARVLRLISKRWHGNLSAYLEAVARVRNASIHTSHNAEDHEVTIESLLRISRRA